MSPMNNRLLVPRKTPGLLDLVPGAAAAYSLRSLSNSYADPVVTVRRGSDDAEEDFTAAEVADGTLAAFCGAGDGFVKTWHSQTGSNDATQTTAGYQPKIVSSGVVITEEGKPAIEFDGNDDHMPQNLLANTFGALAKPLSSVWVASVDSSSSSNAAVFGFGRSTVSTPFIWAGAYGFDNSVRFTKRDDSSNQIDLITSVSGQLETQSLAFGVMDSVSGSLYVNGVASASDTASFSSITLDLFSIGVLPRNTLGAYFFGKIQELIIYPSDLTAQRELIEGLIAWGYSV